MSTLSPESSPGFLLWHATLRWQREVGAALSAFDLTHVQFVLLACTWWLNNHGQDPSQLALATQAGTDVKMTSQVVRKLEGKGLLERETDPLDTRAKKLRVTARGAKVAAKAIAAVERVDERFFGPARSAAGDDALIEMLSRLALRDERAPSGRW